MLRRNPSLDVVTTTIHDGTTLDGLLKHWKDLCGRCVENTVYYEPYYAMALLATVDVRARLKLVTAWKGERLVGFLPVVPNRCPIPGIVASGRAWQTEYTFGCSPLLDAECPEAAASGLLNGLAGLGRGEWIIPDFNVDGPAASAMIWALEARRAPFVFDCGFERATISIGKSFDEHMQTHVAAKRRREMGRNRRRLEERGGVSFRTETEGAGLDWAVGAFLDIESSGWKGKRGTALKCQPQTKAFAARAFGGAGDGGRRRVDLLMLDDRPIAAGVIVFSGEIGFTVKGGFDEEFSGYSAGLLLEQEIIRSFLTERWARRLDSATNGKHVVDQLWPDRSRVADLTFSLADSAPSTRLASLSRVRATASEAKRQVKYLLRR